MSLDFQHGTVRPAFATHIEDAFHGAQVDYCYEDFSPVAESFNVPALPAWAIVTACYTFESASRPGLYHVAVTFKGLVSLPEKQITYCGCEAAQHEKLCWHVGCCEAFEDAAQEAAAAWETLSTPAPFKPGDAVRATRPANGAHVDGFFVRMMGSDRAVVRYFDARKGRDEQAAYLLANITPRVATAKAA